MLRLAASRGGGPRNALGHRPEPEVLPLPAETSREAPKCCAWQHQGGAVQSLKCCLCQQKRAARNALGHRPEPEVLPLPAETSREAPKCWARNALGHRPEPGVLPLQQKRAPASRNEPRGSQVLRLAASRRGGGQTKCCAWQHHGGGPRNPLPAETSREAAKCCA